MEVVLYNNLNDYYYHFKHLFDKHPILLQFFYCHIFNTKIENKNYVFGAVYDDQELVMLFINAYPKKLMFFSLKNSIEAHRYLYEYLYLNNIEIKGVLGNALDVTNFQYGSNLSFALIQKFRMMKLKEFIRQDSEGKLIKVTIKELHPLVEILNKYYLEEENKSLSKQELFDIANIMIKDSIVYLYYDKNNKLVGLSKLVQRSKNGLAITMVYIIKENRNNHLGFYMLQLLLIEALRLEQLIFLNVDENNVTAINLYSKLGFENVIDFYNCELN